MARPNYSQQLPEPEYGVNVPVTPDGFDLNTMFDNIPTRKDYTDNEMFIWPNTGGAYNDPDYLVPTQMQKDTNALERALNPTGEHSPSSQGPWNPIGSAHYPSGLPFGHVPPEDAYDKDGYAKYPYPVPKPRKTHKNLPREFPFNKRIAPPPGVKIPDRIPKEFQGPFSDRRFDDKTPRQR